MKRKDVLKAPNIEREIQHLLFPKGFRQKHIWKNFCAETISQRIMSIERTLEEMNKRKSQPNTYTTPLFAAVRLNSQDKAAAKRWITENFADLETYVVRALIDIWKISFSYDEGNDCYIASFTSRDEKNENYNICVVSRSDNPLEAILISYYKIYIMFDGHKLPTEHESDNWG
jgi:hypothetical protein